MKRLFSAWDHVGECPLCRLGVACLIIGIALGLFATVAVIWFAGGA